jgi:hypothetical protein
MGIGIVSSYQVQEVSLLELSSKGAKNVKNQSHGPINIVLLSK